MYPDLITPRAHPDLLARIDYDPFHVTPRGMPQAPRVFTNADQIRRARQRLATGNRVDKHCFDRLVVACRLDDPLPTLKPADGPPDWGGPLLPWFDVAFHNALAWKLNDDPRHFRKAVDALRLAAPVCATTVWNGNEHNEAIAAARAYDLLAGPRLEAADDAGFREMLTSLIKAMDHAEHRYCNNHNSMQMVGRLSLAAALGDRQGIHDVFYGCQCPKGWRYGLIHLLRHDFLSDGMHWEGALGYHALVLGNVYDCFDVMEHLGVDLWHRRWPSLMQNDEHDEHRGWGPKGMKTLTAAFDALIYQAFPNGDYSLAHDSGLGNLAGARAWWPLFNKAFEVYREPRYAWVLRHINNGRTATADGPVPVWFDDGRGIYNFVRIETRDHPDGENPFLGDRRFALTGTYIAGCSLFPAHGAAVLRSPALVRGGAVDEKALGVYLWWGPHWAGHQAPAQLHLDIHALGRRITNAPHLYKDGFSEPLHLTWFRSTIAHNTVTVDQQSMFPYDFESDSLWEADIWRDSISDGTLELFQPGEDFKAVRAANDNVYAGVKLDRTVIVTREYVLDAYRVTAERTRLLDWAMHCHGEFPDNSHDEAVNLGTNRGYRHISGARLHPQRTGWVGVPFTLDGASARATLWLGDDPGMRLILARDPEPDRRKPVGDDALPQPRTSLIVRTQASEALFVSLWSVGLTAVEGGEVQGSAGGNIVIAVKCNGQTHRWSLPMSGIVNNG